MKIWLSLLFSIKTDNCRIITPIFLHQASWKAHLGNGKADKQEVASVLQQLFELPQLPIDDSVDAIGIAYSAACGLRNAIS